jgi:hypothetical protein
LLEAVAEAAEDAAVRVVVSIDVTVAAVAMLGYRICPQAPPAHTHKHTHKHNVGDGWLRVLLCCQSEGMRDCQWRGEPECAASLGLFITDGQEWEGTAAT